VSVTGLPAIGVVKKASSVTLAFSSAVTFALGLIITAVDVAGGATRLAPQTSTISAQQSSSRSHLLLVTLMVLERNGYGVRE
jgi:hypothetical protein